MLASRTWDYWALWAVAALSLALNVVVINSLLTVRRQAGVAVQAAAAGIERLRAASVTYDVRIAEAVPVNLTVPINETLTVPIDTQLPISTYVQVPVEIPLIGTRTVSFPIEAVIPVKLETDIPVKLTVPISATVPIRLTVPVRLTVAELALDDELAGAEAYLNTLATELGAGPTATPAPRATP